MAPEKQLPQNVADVKLEDIEFDVVKECTDKTWLKRYIQLLQEDGSYFVELLNACKDKLLEVAPKDYYLLFPRVTTQSELDDVTRDLLDWQAAVKETDAALLKAKKQNIWDDVPGKGVTAAIRGQEQVVARPHVQKKERERESKTPMKQSERYARDKTKMRDYYSAWDQVDVDAIEAEMEEEERQEEEARRKHFDDIREEQQLANSNFTPIDVNNVPEAVPSAHRKHLADSEKEKGNEAFYAKDYEEAEAYYSRSLQFLADDPSVWANRALARLKLENQNAAGALEDCEHALAINSRYMKALHRKGKALYELQRYAEAVESFQLALMESPGNTQINGDLMVARRKLRSDGPAPAQPKSFAPPARSQRPDAPSTCVIEEVFDDDNDSPVQSSNAGTTKPAAGYTRVQIEEDSDSEEEEDAEQERERAAEQRAPAAPGFHKVQIVEDSDSEDEAAPNPVAAAPAAAPSAILFRWCCKQWFPQSADSGCQ